MLEHEFQTVKKNKALAKNHVCIILFSMCVGVQYSIMCTYTYTHVPPYIQRVCNAGTIDELHFLIVHFIGCSFCSTAAQETKETV